MSALLWIVIGLWALILLASAVIVLPPLPAPVADVPPYQLWLRGDGAASNSDGPPLDPPPVKVHRGDAPPHDGPEHVLVLASNAQVIADLPRRLAACGAGFVSVFPLPIGGPLGQARERAVRDLAQAEKVRNLTHPAGFADGRCAWLTLADLRLPGVGIEPVLKAARARKAHGLAVDLRDPRAIDAVTCVRAPAHGREALRAGLADALQADQVARAIVVGLPTLLVIPPVIGLLIGAFWLPLVALGIGAAARGMTAYRDGFGRTLPVLGPVLELYLASEMLLAPLKWPQADFPTLPDAAPQSLTGAAERRRGAWLEGAGVPFLARRLGGATAVMEQIYRNTPVGRTRLGRVVDRWVHASPAARAVRHRFCMTVSMGRALQPQSLLSIPCGGGRDAAAIGAPTTVLIDPDQHARSVSAAQNPNAQVLSGTLDTLPDARFDLILFVGLAEYLEDPVLVRGLTALRERLAPNGVLLCTTTAANPDMARMGQRLGWETKARAPADLERVLDAAGFAIEARQHDPLGIQWLFVARPVVTPA